MSRLTAKDFDPKLLQLYDFYAHGIITKREFLQRAAKFTVAGMTATTVLGLMSPNYALAEQVSFNDPDMDLSRFSIHALEQTLRLPVGSL